jgi:hypothetical protein
MKITRESPILTRVLDTFGWVTIILGVIGGVAMCVTESMTEGIVIIVGGVFAGIIYIGIAQAVDYLARTAHFTERLCTTLETSMLRLSKSIEFALVSSKPSTQKKSIPPPPPPSPRPPAVYHFVLDGSDQGPFTHIDMRDFRAASVVADDTPVFREGEAEWRTYRDFSELSS